MFSLKNLFHIHKWKDVVRPAIHYFLEEKVIRYFTVFQVCEKCGKAKDYYGFLDEERTRILKTKLVDEGVFFTLKVKDLKNRPVIYSKVK